MRITLTSYGSFRKIESFLRNATKKNLRSILNAHGQAGVRALASATEKDSGQTASSWYYEVIKLKDGWKIVWSNSNIDGGFPVAVMLQYGHATGTGGWVQGVDYINPALKPIFDKIADQAWKEVMAK